MLAYNYSILQSWPLAITAYNHGVAGMRRAVRKTGSDDFTQINREYQGRTFGFASRNFYLAFIAALEVEQNADQYFGAVRKDQPGNEITIKVPDYVPADALAEALGVSEKTLKQYNPSLLSPVWWCAPSAVCWAAESCRTPLRRRVRSGFEVEIMRPVL